VTPHLDYWKKLFWTAIRRLLRRPRNKSGGSQRHRGKLFIYRPLVNDAVIVEIKSVENLAPIHEAQLLSYLKISGGKIGLLLNFNVKMLKYGGIKRLAN
jgi:hypothetical protein